ncbi:MAG: hypothetical protein SF069_00795 [Phycisphaerae bacterium]|nr:hypothetical protein [Phycisphaerae bacterium]
MSIDRRAQRAHTPRWPHWRIASLAFVTATVAGWWIVRPWLVRLALQVPYYQAKPLVFAGAIGERFPERAQATPSWSVSFLDNGDWLRPIFGAYNIEPHIPVGSLGEAGLRYFVLTPNLEDCGGFRGSALHVESHLCADWDDDGFYELPLIVHGRKPDKGLAHQTLPPAICVLRIKPTITEIVAIVEELPGAVPHDNRWLLNVQAPRTIGSGMYRLFVERIDRMRLAGWGPASAPTASQPVTNVRLGSLKWTRPGGTLRAVGEWAPELRVYTPPIDQPWILPPEMKLQDLMEKIIAEEQPQIPDAD